jgi:hypothetical protein
MAINDILTQQATWLDSLRKGFPATSATGISGAPGTVEAQVNVIEARIADLTRQKAAVTQQFDAAIATHNNALAALKASSATAQVLQPIQSAGTTVAGKESG